MATSETNVYKQLKSTSNINQTASSPSASLNKSQQSSLCNNNQQEIDCNINTNSNSSCLKSLDVKTKSIENTLLPLVNQVIKMKI